MKIIYVKLKLIPLKLINKNKSILARKFEYENYLTTQSKAYNYVNIIISVE